VVEVRVLSYNVRSLRDDPSAVATVIRICAPDVVCIQEAPRFLRWRSKCAALARESGLVVVAGGRAAAAMLVLGSLRTRVVSTRNVLLDYSPGLHQRGLATAVLEIGGARFGVASMHLSLDDVERRRQADAALASVDRIGADHVVLAGDVNESPNRPSWQRLAESLQDCWAVAPWGGEFTNPAQDPVRRIDGIFASKGIEVRRCGVPGIAEARYASDHLPVLAVLGVPRPA
jgi:endonuclease/exonuclease/phosphatase family metal-dependent hydrolase